MAASWKTLRVFISSTFRDMQAERDQLVRFVFPKLREELLKRRIHLIDVDLRWGVTSDQDAVSVCREVIDECRPRFMGMLGGRYGWVPDGHERSITEDEVHYGVLERDAEIWGNAFFYFRNEESTASIVEETPGDFREPAGSENARKLAKLKQSIVDARLPVFVYGSTWDVQEKRLMGLEAFGDHVFADLLQNIQDDPELDDHFARSAGILVSEFAEERDAMEAFIENRTERYVVGSRQALLDRMTAFAAGSSEQNILVIEGGPGSGKSALLGKFCQLLASRRHDVLISHFVGASVGSTDLRRTLRRLCHELATTVNNSDPLPEDPRELIDRFRKLLGEVAARQRVTLIVDALNQFDATDGAHDMQWLPLTLPPNVRVIVSSLEHPVLVALRKRSEPVRIEKLESLRMEDAQAIIEAFLHRYSKRFSAEQISALLAKGESLLPLYLLIALQELRTLGTYEEITSRIEALPDEVKALFRWILKKRLSHDPGFRDVDGRLCGSALVTKFASCLGVSRHGLSQRELIGLIDPEDPQGNVAALLRLLRPYLMHRGEMLDFFHSQLREAVEDTYLEDTHNRRSSHQFLASYFHDIADPTREGRWKGNSVHSLSELPYHQTRARAWPQLVATLENIFFLEAKVTHGMVFDITADFSDALEHLPPDHPQQRNLKLLEEALRRDLHFIDGHAQDYPQALFQCFWNSCWWYDCPQAARHYAKEGIHWNRTGEKLYVLMERWREARKLAQSPAPWLRLLRPPPVQLGTSQKLVLRGHEDEVTSVAFLPDDKRVASASRDSTIRIWNLQTGRELACLRGHRDEVWCVAASADGRLLASAGWDGTARIWDVEKAEELQCLEGHSLLAFSKDGRFIATESGDAVLLWNSESGDLLRRLAGHVDRVYWLAFSPDNRVIASADGSFLRLWDIQTGEELSCYRVFHPMPTATDSMRLVAQDDNGQITVLDACSAHVLSSFWLKEKLWSAALSADGNLLASGTMDRSVRIWNTADGSEKLSLHGHEHQMETCQPIASVIFSHNGERLASCGDDETVRVWSIGEGRQGPTLDPGDRSYFSSVTFSPDGRRLLAAAGHWAMVWDVEANREKARLFGYRDGFVLMALTPDGHRVIFGGACDDYEPALRTWDIESGRMLYAARGHQSQVLSIAVARDGRGFASGDYDGTVRLWDSESGQELLCFRRHTGPIRHVAFSPDGSLIASAGEDCTVRIWTVVHGEELHCLGEHGSLVRCAAFSADGRYIASGGDDGVVRVFSVASGFMIYSFNGHAEPITAVAFSLDGKCVVSQGDYELGNRGSAGGVRVWSLHSRHCLRETQGCGDIAAIAAGPSHFRWLAFGGLKETTIQLAANGETVGAIMPGIHNIVTHPSGRIWAGSDYNNLHIIALEGVDHHGQTPER